MIIPNRSTVWAFRERLAETGQDREIWDELQRQIKEDGLEVKNGMMLDTTS